MSIDCRSGPRTAGTFWRRTAAVIAVSTAVLLGGMVAAAPATAATGPAWSVMPTPNPVAPQAALEAVSCSSSKACMAVGNYNNRNGVQLSLAEAWIGSTWKVEPTPNPARTGEVQLLGISCTSPAACTAVGFSQQGQKLRDQLTLVESWNGRHWKIEPTPNPAGSPDTQLTAVSCTSLTACTAVGWQSVGNTEAPLAETWNGQKWAMRKTPMAASSRGGQLLGVSCTSAAACTAVGWQATPSLVTLAEVWNGSSWAMQATPNATGEAGAQGSGLSAVSCSPDSTRCTAVGYSNSSKGEQVTLAEARNGTTWKVQPTPTPTGTQGIVQGFLNGVSCTSATACSAAGDHIDDAGNQVPLMESWNGASWKIKSAPAARYSTTISGISCPVARECTAAGVDINQYALAGDGDSFTLVEAWNGKAWTIRSTPDLSGLVYNTLSAVSCASPASCVAVGEYERGDGMLSEIWNGTKWTIQSMPAPASEDELGLTAVSCVAPSYCVAIGWYETESSSDRFTLSEIWNGSTWTIQSMPTYPDGALFSVLSGVSCISPTACTAVGWDDANGSSTLVETWNGTNWEVPSTPNVTGADSNVLTAVSCASSTSCSAVGEFAVPGEPFMTLAETWNGEAWAIQSTPDAAGTTDNYLTGVSCPSADECLASGYSNASKGTQTLSEVLSGGKWTIEATPNPGNGGRLFAVSCSSTTACSAVGDFGTTDSNFDVTLAEHWNGRSWVGQPTHTKGVRVYQATELESVSCTSPTFCMSAGWNERYYVTGTGALRAVVERYS